LTFASDSGSFFLNRFFSFFHMLNIYTHIIPLRHKNAVSTPSKPLKGHKKPPTHIKR
jgi:hypothetical protein